MVCTTVKMVGEIIPVVFALLGIIKFICGTSFILEGQSASGQHSYHQSDSLRQSGPLEVSSQKHFLTVKNGESGVKGQEPEERKSYFPFHCVFRPSRFK